MFIPFFLHCWYLWKFCNTSFKLGCISDSFSYYVFPTMLYDSWIISQAGKWANRHFVIFFLIERPHLSSKPTFPNLSHATPFRTSLSIVVISCNLFQNGDTALHIAAAMGRRKLTKILLESGCDKESKNKQGETSLEISRRKNLVDIITILQNPPPLLSQEDRQDQVCTPWALWRSFEYCKFCLSKFFLDLGNQ